MSILKTAIALLLTCMIQPAVAALPADFLQPTLLKQGYKEVTLQQATQQNTLLVTVSLKPGYFHPFVLDTGATWLAVGNKLVSLYDLKSTGLTAITGGGDAKRHSVLQVHIPYLQVGPVISRNTIAYTQETAFMRVDKQPIGGLLGLNYLRQHQALVDVANRRLYLQPRHTKMLSAFQNNLTVQLMAAGYRMITLKPTPSHHQVVDVQVNGASPVVFLLDTGVPMTTVSSTYAKKLRVKIHNLVNRGKGSGGGKIHFFPAELQTLNVGGAIESHVNVMTMDFQYIQVGVPLAGIIGLDWLQKHHAIIDVAQERLFVRQ